jgi:hypothetical protein
VKNIAEVKSQIAEVKPYASTIIGGGQRVHFFNLTFDFCDLLTMTPASKSKRPHPTSNQDFYEISA